MLDVMLILGKYGAHRTWVVQSPGGDITNVPSHNIPIHPSCAQVISQSGVVALLAANMEQFHELTGKTIGELHVGTYGGVISVSPSDTYWGR